MKLHLRRKQETKLLALGPELGRVDELYLHLYPRTGIRKSFLMWDLWVWAMISTMRRSGTIALFLLFIIGNCYSQVESQLRPVVVGQNGAGTGVQITIEFPGYLALKFGDGSGTKPCPKPLGGINCQGIWSLYDLKNDAAKKFEWGAQDTGLSQHQWNSVKNSDGTERWSEVKEGGQSCQISETNNVRTVLTCSGPVYRYGNKAAYPTPDCCVTLSKTYVFYRHGGEGGLKIYTQTSLSYDGKDGKGPLSLPNNNLYTDFRWSSVTGEDVEADHTNISGCGHFGVLTPSPLNLQYQAPGKDGDKDYNLLTPTDANSTRIGEFIGANPCAGTSGHGLPGPLGTPGQPPSGTVFRCEGATATQCNSQTSLGRILHINVLQISKEPIRYMNLTSNPPAAFFIGGIRFQNFLPAETLAVGKPLTWTSVFFLGDNGVTTTRAADALTAEYKTHVPKLIFRNGVEGRFDSKEGYWAIRKTGRELEIAADGDLHSPAFLISTWDGGVPLHLTFNGSTRKLNSDFVAVKLDRDSLLLQLLFDLNKRAQITLEDSQ